MTLLKKWFIKQENVQTGMIEDTSIFTLKNYQINALIIKEDIV